MKRIGIRTKLAFLITLLLLPGMIFLSSYFSLTASNLLHQEFKKRGIEIVRNLAYTSKEGIGTKNLFGELKPLVEAVKSDPDIDWVAIVDRNGKVLAHTNPKEVGKIYVDESTKKILLSKEVICSEEIKEIMTIGLSVEARKEEVPLTETEELTSKETETIGAVIIGISFQNLHTRIKNILKVSITIILALIIIGMLITFYLSTRMTSSIRLLTETTRIISKGDLEKRVRVKSHDEIGELATSFNQMVEDLKKAQDEAEKSKTLLEKNHQELADGLAKHFEVLKTAATGNLNIKAPLTSENNLLNNLGEVINHTIENLKLFADEMIVKQELNQIFNFSPSAIRVVNREFNVIKVNKTYIELSGLKEENLIGGKCYNQIKHAESCHTEQCPVTKMLLEPKTIELEMETITPEGKKLYCLFKSMPLLDTERNLIGIIQDLRDITPLKNMEKELENTYREMTIKLSDYLEVLDKISQGDTTVKASEESNIKLIANLGQVINRTGKLINARIQDIEAVNKELESFTYSASHDLKEPLRGIEAFSQFLLEDYQDRLDETGKDYLKRLSTSAVRMKGLIDDLLALSRISRIKNPYTSVDLGKLVKEVIKRLKPIIDEKKAKIEIDDELPFIFCDEVKIKEVFYNLISNAIKYNDKETPKIEIGFEGEIVDGVSQLVISVKDNGIGIKEEYFDEIFGIFKRLHGKDEYGGGTGAGLAIVKRVIDDHHGKVWVKSALGQGSTFYFSLPKT